MGTHLQGVGVSKALYTGLGCLPGAPILLGDPTKQGQKGLWMVWEAHGGKHGASMEGSGARWVPIHHIGLIGLVPLLVDL